MAVSKQQSKELDKQSIEKIKEELQARKKQVLEDLDLVARKDETKQDKHIAKFPDFGDKTDENAQEISEYSTNLAAEKVLESTLRDINSALKRIEEGSYGVCKYCSKEIGKKRMLARPVASACVECKTKLQSAV